MEKTKTWKTNVTRVINAVLIMSLSLLSTIQVSFAKGEGAHFEITKKFINIFNDGRDDLILFGSAAFGVCGGVCLLTIMFCKRQNLVDGAFDWGKRIVICYVGLLSLITITTLVKGFSF